MGRDGKRGPPGDSGNVHHLAGNVHNDEGRPKWSAFALSLLIWVSAIVDGLRRG
jgi:hypothetical protein